MSEIRKSAELLNNVIEAQRRLKSAKPKDAQQRLRELKEAERLEAEHDKRIGI